MEILFFSAPWCKKCPEELSDIQEVVQGKIPLKEINIDEDSKLKVDYGVRNIPAIVVIAGEDDVMLDRVQGKIQKFQVENFFRDLGVIK